MLSSNFKSKFKLIIIVLLSISAIYMTGQLWFVEISGRNFFYIFSYVFNSGGAVIEASDGSIALPYRIITSFGGNRFDVLYNGIKASSQKKEMDEAILLFLRKGEFVSSKEIDWDYALNRRAYIYEYNFSMPSDVFHRSFNLKSSNINGKVKRFDMMIISPPKNNKEAISAIFVDYEANQQFEYTIKNDVLAEKLNSGIDSIGQKSSGLVYVSSALSEYPLLSKNIFVPKWNDDNLKYAIIDSANPYIVKEQLLLKTIEKKVDLFFDKPASKRSYTSNDVFTYGDEGIVVKYYPNDVLEYYDYRTPQKQTSANFESDYYVAKNFLQKDVLVTNEFYLSSYEGDETKNIFCFDYAVNNFSMKLSPSVANDISMRHPIEITVENGRVRKYRKLTYSFSVNENVNELALLDFEGSMEMFQPINVKNNEDGEEEATLFDDASFCYNIDAGKQLMLYWFLSLDGRVYAQSALSGR